MSKLRRLLRHALKKDDPIFIDYGIDPLGRYWWRCYGEYRGPFLTKNEAIKDADVTIPGPPCEITFSGWDSPL